jgi:DNA-binding transcriptional regulator YiaG
MPLRHRGNTDMCAVIISREINVTTIRDEDDLAYRKKRCAEFRARLRGVHLSAKAFSELTGYSINTVYNWQNRSSRCIPPAPAALRVLSLIERDLNIVSALQEITSKESN